MTASVNQAAWRAQRLKRKQEAPGGTGDLDDFPTPPHATRAFCDLILTKMLGIDLSREHAWEPAANRGHMVRPLREYFASVVASDVYDYGAGFDVFDFLAPGGGGLLKQSVPDYSAAAQWIVSNPPFKTLNRWIVTAEEFGGNFALMCRLQALETMERNAIFAKLRPHLFFAQYVDRVTMVEGKIVRRTDTGSNTATAYGWLVFVRDRAFNIYIGDGEPFASLVTMPMVFIPPCRKFYERDEDYR